jgi:hypothetical protein
MNPQRFTLILAGALAAHRRCSHYRQQRNQILPPPRAIPMADLPSVSLEEAKWLDTHQPKALAFTKGPFQSSQYWKPNPLVPSSARHPVVREIWIGQRSLQCLSSKEDAELEDIAEATDLQTLLHPGHENVRRSAIWRHCYVRYRDVIRKFPWAKDRMAIWKAIAQEAHLLFGNTVVIEDPESGEPRFLRPGDVIEVVWGSNEDLDALYMEEPADERSFHDSLERELQRDRVNPASYQEQSFRDDPDRVIHIDALRQSETIEERDEFRLRQQASRMTDRHFERFPNSEYPALAVYDAAYNHLVNSEHQWLDRKDFFAQIETNLRTRPKVRRAAPPAVNWQEVGERM